MLFCLLDDSPRIEPRERGSINRNQGLVARRGRDPSLRLSRADGRQVRLTRWAEELFDALEGPGMMLDEAHQSSRYRDNLAGLRARIEAPEQTPSAMVLAEMQERDEEFVQFAMRVSEQHRQHFVSRPLSDDVRRQFAEAARDSLAEQRRLEESDSLSFEAYLAAYFRES